MAEIHGECKPQFEKLRAIFKEFVDSEEELGASLCVNIDGKNVIDLWGGYADKERTKPWNEDTITTIFSSSKTVTALAGLMLIDRGLLDPEEKVAHYWPEFAANGKENVLVKHILSHTSGLSGWEEPVSFEQCCDFEYAAGLLAAQAPWWEPGMASGYHSLTMGFPIGKLCRIVDGRSLKDFIQEELAEPLGADFQLGVAEKDRNRYSPVVPPPPPPADFKMDFGPAGAKTFMNPPMDANYVNREVSHNAELGAANGAANAKGISKILSVVTLGGEVDGKRIISQKTLDLIFQEQANGKDQAIGTPLRFGLGFGLTPSGDPQIDSWLPEGKRICFWGGWGGSIIVMDLDHKATIAYDMNKMSNIGLANIPARRYMKEIYEVLRSGKQ